MVQQLKGKIDSKSNMGLFLNQNQILVHKTLVTLAAF